MPHVVGIRPGQATITLPGGEPILLNNWYQEVIRVYTGTTICMPANGEWIILEVMVVPPTGFTTPPIPDTPETTGELVIENLNGVAQFCASGRALMDVYCSFVASLANPERAGDRLERLVSDMTKLAKSTGINPGNAAAVLIDAVNAWKETLIPRPSRALLPIHSGIGGTLRFERRSELGVHPYMLKPDGSPFEVQLLALKKTTVELPAP